jgi:hypothetical protein
VLIVVFVFDAVNGLKKIRLPGGPEAFFETLDEIGNAGLCLENFTASGGSGLPLSS